ncbi:hypothetical protein QBC38DRAFT_451600 [Podospora fimiseda]|uniref:Myb-like domain-containing protein n=1 Tax=Podospora fimiseda TaxID=252190 RepID=A0AAN7BXJ1_9PEZI|nr:hypothetical protein QBC38DRAFT_451600 [Podospora fimiseda]
MTTSTPLALTKAATHMAFNQNAWSKIDQGPWTEEEDEALEILAKSADGQDNALVNWNDIATQMGSKRRPSQCMDRYHHYLWPRMRRERQELPGQGELVFPGETYDDAKRWGDIVVSEMEGEDGWRERH